MKEYYLIEQVELVDLMNEANQMIKKGWIPQGGASRYSIDGESKYLQAMALPKS